MPKVRTIRPEVLAAATQALKGLPDSKVQFRLLAIVKASEKGISAVCDFFSVHYNTLSRWIQKFEKGGVAALQDKPKGHFPSKLSPEHLDQIAHWLETQTNEKGQPTHWTLETLRQEISGVFSIKIAIGPLWGHLQRLGYRHKSVRPKHTNQPDAEAIEAFKKTPMPWCKPF